MLRLTNPPPAHDLHVNGGGQDFTGGNFHQEVGGVGGFPTFVLPGE